MNVMEINGVYGSATVYLAGEASTAIDQYALAQLRMLCDNEASHGSLIRVMPDVHPGKVCTIGLTMTVSDRILPEIVGIDIGCGVSIARIEGFKKEYQKLDAVIREFIPTGFAIHTRASLTEEDIPFDSLFCARSVNREKAILSMGTLGGGNHFIEVDTDDDGSFYLAVHTGSRHLGKEVTDYYLREGSRLLKASGKEVPYEMTYLTGELMENYIHDAGVAAEYASRNRQSIISCICKEMKWKLRDSCESVHNYIGSLSDKTPIIRKGAISAGEGERVIIPINMRDGIILGTGKGNPDWNQSAPHGAGRILKREEVKNRFTVSSYKKEMQGIYSSTIGVSTLDEAPFAYRGWEEISAAVKETVRIEKRLMPIYNYKPTESENASARRKR